MRISDARYSRDRLRFDLALRFIQHEARTSTIRAWTGLTDDRIRKLCRDYPAETGQAPTRHRGRAPRQAAFFIRSARLRRESSLLASVCYLLGVVPPLRVEDAPRSLPDVGRGMVLCEAYETYRQMVGKPRISFEHAVGLVMALADGDELRATRCRRCQGLVVAEPFRLRDSHCAECQTQPEGRTD
ncbi:MAG: hypothetical protein RL026_1056 [Pseudomonadota bacterium]|jgi:hypothetical protein